MANRYILPAALAYQKDVAESVSAVKGAGGSVKEAKKVLDRVTALVDDLRTRTDKLEKTLDGHAPSAAAHAKHIRDVVVPAMNNLRDTADAIECLMPHGAWPLPTYREMLFIK
jgi:glutamine synthetase